MSLIKQKEVLKKSGNGTGSTLVPNGTKNGGPTAVSNGEKNGNDSTQVLGGRADRVLNKQDLESMMVRFATGMRKHAHSIVGSAELAEDVMQEVFTRTISEVGRGRVINASKIGSWLHTCVRNTALSVVREQKRHPQVHLDDGEDIAMHKSTHEVAHMAERSKSVMNALSLMTERQSTAFLLSDVHGLSYDQTANEMGTSADSVRQLLFRARKELRRHLGPETAGLAAPILRVRSGLPPHDPGFFERAKEQLNYLVGKYLNLVGAVEDRAAAFATPVLAAVVIGGIVAVGIFSSGDATSGGNPTAEDTVNAGEMRTAKTGSSTDRRTAGVTLRRATPAPTSVSHNDESVGGDSGSSNSGSRGSGSDLSDAAKTASLDSAGNDASFSTIFSGGFCALCSLGPLIPTEGPLEGEPRNRLRDWIDERKEIRQERREARQERREARQVRRQARRENRQARRSDRREVRRETRQENAQARRSERSSNRGSGVSRRSNSGNSSRSRDTESTPTREGYTSSPGSHIGTSPSAGDSVFVPSAPSPITSPVTPVMPSPGDTIGAPGGGSIGGGIGDGIGDDIGDRIGDGIRDRSPRK